MMGFVRQSLLCISVGLGLVGCKDAGIGDPPQIKTFKTTSQTTPYTITWQVENATACEIRGNGCLWASASGCDAFYTVANTSTGFSATSGSIDVSPSVGLLTMQLTCRNANSQSTEAEFSLAPPTTVSSFDVFSLSVTASPSPVGYLAPVTITATVTGGIPTDTCTANGGVGDLVRSGTTFTGTGRFASTTTVTVTCTRGNTTIRKDVTVTVNAPAADHTSSISTPATPISVGSCDFIVTPDGTNPEPLYYKTHAESDLTTLKEAASFQRFDQLSEQALSDKTICLTNGVHFLNRTDATLTTTKDDSLTLTGSGSVTFVGGFPNAASSESRTILDGRYLSRIMTLKGPSSGTRNVVMKNMVFRSGQMSEDAESARGGCLRIENNVRASLENVDFIECVQSHTVASLGYGGAIYLTGDKASLSWRGGLAMGNDATRGMVLSAHGGSSTYIESVTVRNNGSGVGFVDNFEEHGPIAIEDDGTAVSVVNTLFQNNSGEYHGGAISLTNNSLLDVSGCVFRNNSAARNGGAIGAHGSSAVNPVVRISHSLFELNNAYYDTYDGYGGAISFELPAASRGTLLIHGSRFVDNVANQDGGALRIINADVTLDNSTFESNKSGRNGGAMYLNDSSTSARAAGGLNVQIRNSRFSSNIAADLTADDGKGGALFFLTGNGASPIGVAIDDTIFENNASQSAGGAIFLAGQAANTATIRRSAFMTNTVRNDEATATKTGLGGAVYAEASTSLDISDSEFSGNRSYGEEMAAGAGGAIYGDAMSSLKIARSIFAYNRTEIYGGAIRLLNTTDTLEITDSDFWGNSLSTRVAGKRGLAIVADVISNGFIRGSTFRSHVGSSFLGEMDNYGGTVHFTGKIGDAATPFRIEDTRFEDNVFTNGVSAGISSQDMEAGGLLVQRCTFARNSASRAAAMIVAGTCTGTLSIVDSQFMDNVSNASVGDDPSTGGALHLNTADMAVVIESSLFKGNMGRVGGAINLYGNSLSAAPGTVIRNSSFLSNRAYRSASDTTGGEGGAIYVRAGTHTIVNNTFAGNIADSDGGAIYQAGGVVYLYLDTFVGNTCKGAECKTDLVKLISGTVIEASLFASAAPTGVDPVPATSVCVPSKIATATLPALNSTGLYYYDTAWTVASTETDTTKQNGCNGENIALTAANGSTMMNCTDCVEGMSSVSAGTREDADDAGSTVFPGRHYPVVTRRLYVANTEPKWPGSFALPSEAVEAINKFARIKSDTSILENYEVWVKKGMYQEPLDIALPERSAWYGGFAGTETALYQRPVPFSVAESAWSIIRPLSDPHQLLRFGDINGEAVCSTKKDSMTIDGFVLDGGTSVSANLHAGGLTVRCVKNAVVRNIVFKNNIGSPASCLYARDTDLVLENIKATENTSTEGTPLFGFKDAVIRIENALVQAQGATQNAFDISARIDSNATRVYARNITIRSDGENKAIHLSAGTPEVYVSDSIITSNSVGGSAITVGNANSKLLFANTCLAVPVASGDAGKAYFAWNVNTNVTVFDTFESNANTLKNTSACVDAVQPLPPCPLAGADTNSGASGEMMRWCVDSKGTERICRYAGASPVWTCNTTILADRGTARMGSTRNDKLVDVGRKDMGFHTPGRVWYVDTSVSASGDGKSWTTAFKALQNATDAATSGDAIWVADGTYRPSHARGVVMDVPAGVSVLGGFSGRETNPSQRRKGVASTVTVLDGDIDGGGTWSAEDASHVVTNKGNIALDGLSIIGGNGRSDSGGGAMLSLQVGESALLSNLDIADNAAMNGGGLFVDGTSASPVVLYHVRATNNRASNHGGGVYLDADVNALIDGGSLNNNGAEQNGGALYSAGKVELRNIVIDNNAALKGGGIALASPVSTMLSNVQLSRNDAGLGGGVYGGKLEGLVFNQSTIAENTADNGAIMFFDTKEDAATVTMNNVVIANNKSYASASPLPISVSGATAGTYANSCVVDGTAATGITLASRGDVAVVPWLNGSVTYVLPKASVCHDLGQAPGSYPAKTGVFDLRALSTSPSGESEYSRDTCAADTSKRDAGYHAPAQDRKFCTYRPGID